MLKCIIKTEVYLFLKTVDQIHELVGLVQNAEVYLLMVIMIVHLFID